MLLMLLHGCIPPQIQTKKQLFFGHGFDTQKFKQQTNKDNDMCIKNKIALTVLIVLMALACTSEVSNLDTTLVQPGTTTRPLGALRFTGGLDAHANTTGPPTPFTACKMVQNVGSVALVEFGAVGPLVPMKDDCTGPYSGDAFIIPSQVYGVAAGEALPEQLDLVLNAGIGLHVDPRSGGTWLVTLRSSEGQWFITNALAVTLEESGVLDSAPPTTDHELTTEFSSDFYTLSDNLTERVLNRESSCPEETAQRMDDLSFRNYSYDPTARPGSNCHATSGNKRQDSSIIDEEDLPPSGGTDDSIQP
jgi:hypothetical protein